MKKLFFLIITFFVYCSLYADQREFLFSAKTSTGTYLATTIIIYSYDTETNGYTKISTSGSTSTSPFFSIWNGRAYVRGVSGQDSTTTVDPNPLDSVATYLIRVENLYVIIHPSAQGFDAQIYYTVTNGTPSLTVSTAATVIAENEPWSQKTISLRNDFGGDRDSVSGKVYLHSEEITTGYSYASRYRQAADFPQGISGEDNQYLSGNGVSYYRKWRTWDGGITSISQSLSTVTDYNKTATYARQCNITIQNDFGAAGSGGTIKFGGNTQNSPYQPISPVYEDVNSTVEGLSQSLSYIDFTFNHWEFESGNIGSSNPKTDFKPTSHGTLKAKFTGKPTNGYRSLSFNTNEEGQPIKVTWSKHTLDNSDVTKYYIYRKVTTGGTPFLLDSVFANGSGTYTYTDNDYAICSGENKILLFYDVRAYYSPSHQFADADFGAVYGFYNTEIDRDNTKPSILMNEVPTDYSISNYPNPFNPTTTINYQLPKNGFVTIKVYDLLGKEVATLVNESKSAGYHIVNFDASKLTSGVYVYTINTNGFVQSKKMLLMK